MAFFSGCGGDADYKPIDFFKTVPIAHPDTGTPREKVLRVAVAAMISPRETFIYDRELLDYIGSRSGHSVQLIQRKTYDEVNAELRAPARTTPDFPAHRHRPRRTGDGERQDRADGRRHILVDGIHGAPRGEPRVMLDLFTRELGFSGIPPAYDRLERCPEMFDGQLATMQRAVAVVPRDRWMRVGLVVARLTGCKFFSTHCAAWLEHRGIAPAAVIAGSEGVEDAPADTEEACLRFTRDITLHSHKISAERVDELRNAGLSDGAILDIAYVAGVFNGMVGLVTALAPLEGAVLA